QPWARRPAASSSAIFGMGPLTACGAAIRIRSICLSPWRRPVGLGTPRASCPGRYGGRVRAARLLMLLHDYYPEEVRVVSEARAAVAAGFEVDVLALRGSGE